MSETATSSTPHPSAHADDTYQQDIYGEDFQDEEMDKPVSRRPRRRLLTPLTAALFAVLLGVCGFIIGVQVEKSEVPAAGSTGGGRAAALSAAGGGALAGAAGTGEVGGGSGRAPGASAAGTGGVGGSAGRSLGAGATIGQVAYVSGDDLYVSTLQGNTVKVRASGAEITKSVSTSVKGVHPGDTVVVTGAAGSDGAVTASAIRDSDSSGASGGGLAGLFGGGGVRGGSSAGTASSGGGASRAGGGGEPALFGR